MRKNLKKKNSSATYRVYFRAVIIYAPENHHKLGQKMKMQILAYTSDISANSSSYKCPPKSPRYNFNSG